MHVPHASQAFVMNYILNPLSAFHLDTGSLQAVQSRIYFVAQADLDSLALLYQLPHYLALQTWEGYSWWLTEISGMNDNPEMEGRPPDLDLDLRQEDNMPLIWILRLGNTGL